MPLNKNQVKRFIKLIAEMKGNKYPNTRNFAEMLREAALYGNESIGCTPKTIQRDISILKTDFNAPIKFDASMNGYYLTRKTWNLYCPVLQDEVVLASVLGSKLAADLMPEPVKSTITGAVEEQLTTNGPDFMDTMYISSLIAASGVKVHIDPAVFAAVFDAWQKHEALDIEYATRDGEISERRIEPHVLTYYNSAWYIKGFCLKQNDVRVFAIHRIRNAEPCDKYFEPDPLIIKEAENGKIFQYDTIKNIEIHCSKAIAGYVREQHDFHNEDVAENDDGSVSVFIKEAPEHDILKWVLSEGGAAKVVKPKSLAKKIVQAAEKVAKTNRS